MAGEVPKDPPGSDNIYLEVGFDNNDDPIHMSPMDYLIAGQYGFKTSDLLRIIAQIAMINPDLLNLIDQYDEYLNNGGKLH